MVDDYANPEKKALADACVDRLFHWVLAHGGAITGEHGIGLAKAKWFRKAVGKAPTTCTNWSNPPWTQKFAESWKNGASVT